MLFAFLSTAKFEIIGIAEPLSWNNEASYRSLGEPP